MFVSYSLTGGGHFEQACEGECKDQPTAAVSKRPLAPTHSNDDVHKIFALEVPLALPGPNLQSLSPPLSLTYIRVSRRRKKPFVPFALKTDKKATTKK